MMVYFFFSKKDNISLHQRCAGVATEEPDSMEVTKR